MQNLKLIDYTKKKLDDMYLIMYAIKNDLNIKKGDIIENVDVYTLVGINKKGIRQLVGIYQDRPLNNRYWLDIFETIKSRGLKNILFLAIDENKNFKRTVKITFPSVVFVDAVTYIAPRFDKYTSEKSSKKVVSRIHNLYSQQTLTEFKICFDSFKESYNNTIHKKLIEKYLNNVEKYYKWECKIKCVSENLDTFKM